jgi:hypothetical protein
MKEEVRNEKVKKSILELDYLQKQIKENTSSIVSGLLNEAIEKEITESEDETKEDEFEVEEVQDTETDGDVAETDETGGFESIEDDEQTEESETDVEDTEVEEEDEWSKLSDYKLSDNEYDLSNVNDEDFVKIFKLMDDDDQVVIVKHDDGKLDIEDHETGAEYILDLGSETDQENEEKNIENMDESIIYEVTLGYTDNYQDKDAMTTPDMTEPAVGKRDIDAGVPKGKEKPFSKLKKTVAPFTELQESDSLILDIEDEEEPVEEGTVGLGGEVQRRSTTKGIKHGEKPVRNGSKNGMAGKTSVSPTIGTTNEEVAKKVKAIFEEHKMLKQYLSEFKKTLSEAVITNVNLGQIVKLVIENTTTQEEKQDIVKRFSTEAKTIEQSKSLFETISRELKKNDKINENLDKQFTTNGSKKVNETTVYTSPDLLASLNLMNKICK